MKGFWCALRDQTLSFVIIILTAVILLGMIKGIT